MSGNPTSNVVPINPVAPPSNWPGPMFMPKTWPQPPSCFSELASLNACYDSIQMMNQILGKVITDLVTNDKAVQAAIVEAIAASGSNVPLIGVTNGSQAQPGQVGEYLEFDASLSYLAGNNSQAVSTMVLPPGDWDVQASVLMLNNANSILGVQFVLQPIPPGVVGVYASSMVLNAAASAAEFDTMSVTTPVQRANVTVPTLLVYQLGTYASASGAIAFLVRARRMR
jgi:hypothetical protein